MKTVAITGKKQALLIEVPQPHPFGNFAVVRIYSAPMCTEYRAYFEGRTSVALGHEAAGEVVETPSGSSLRVGTRVVVMPQYPCGTCHLCLQGDYIYCRQLHSPIEKSGNDSGTATYAEYMLKPDWLLLPVPDDIGYDEASMACCGLGPAFGAGKAMNINSSDTVMVMGLGPVGLGAVINSAHRGARVIGITRNPYRRRLAIELGADIILDATHPDALDQIMDLTAGKGVEKVIECSGSQQYQRFGIDAAACRGQIAFVGESGDLTVDVSKDLLRKGLTIYGIWHWNLQYASEMFQLIRETKNKIARLITHKFPMSEVNKAFELQMTGECGKVILHPAEE